VHAIVGARVGLPQVLVATELRAGVERRLEGVSGDVIAE
jgi:hypothetical protein